MVLKLDKFGSRKELFKYIVENEDFIIEEKKSTIKIADSFNYSIASNKSFGLEKSRDLLKRDYLDVSIVINSTNILDSHRDVHINDLFKKSIDENKRIKHLQEHVRRFDHVISDKEDLEVYTKIFNWRELGYEAEGKTQALMFNSRVRKERNPYMFEQYAKNNVDNHSVGMIYVKMATCIDDEEYPVQKENWDKYIKSVVNKAEAEKLGHFWAILEAKCVEGSAVIDGSNPITPTLSVKQALEQEKSTYSEAVKNWLFS